MEERKDLLENTETVENDQAKAANDAAAAADQAAEKAGQAAEKAGQAAEDKKEEQTAAEAGKEAGTGSAGPEKVFCVKCGAEVAPGNAFCPKCGHKVGEKLEQEAKEKSASITLPDKSKMPMIAGIAAAVVALIVIFFVIRGPQPKDVTLNKKEVSVKSGETVSLNCTINPSDVKDKTVTWSSSNDSIAQVSDGTITGINEGDCTVTVTTKNGKTDNCQVTVLPAGPDLQALYNEYCTSSFASLASDGSHLYVDTNPTDKDSYTDYEAYMAITYINEALDLPESVINRMNQTRSIDGMQTHSTDDLDISWTYHPDRGLEVSYSLK